MQVRLMVERGQNECVVKLAGRSYKFTRNEHGHLVSEITDLPTIAWVSDTRNSAFLPYSPPKPDPIVSAEENKTESAAESEIPLGDEVFDEKVAGFAETPLSDPPEGVGSQKSEETVNVEERMSAHFENEMPAENVPKKKIGSKRKR